MIGIAQQPNLIIPLRRIGRFLDLVTPPLSWFLAGSWLEDRDRVVVDNPQHFMAMRR